MTKLNTIHTIEFKTQNKFEAWLNKNYDKSNGIWLKIFKKDSGIKTISYSEALDVALCYGWIDSQKQTFDEQAWLQKFSPRTAKSIWSKVNIGHVERLSNQGKMKPPGLIAVEKAKTDGRWDKAYDSPSKMSVPDDFLLELSKNKKAEEFFKGLNKTNLFSIGFRIHTAKKTETRVKRIKEIIKKLADGEKI
ncbi:bacteriocin-protection protein, YdeI/OmpD-associated family [Leptospira bourretii]|uniref:Bacteriocin-protection protein, YdeI/OmpD-associated family n=1 Tax=Leptospira bourretii TaxID=2484962 RepID=A0A4R9IJ74_9LEPT|nr:YdeI/OmpD-associated family protein [Leptospira bourretii]TGK88523.1 bacteriocin-protection protein, YdeI/OmpD-associated family [Leptospira bourretii]TGK89169.1 bacteriocin-protection protein, YdeI/OmpD-associated family [Leptospira bourretii]